MGVNLVIEKKSTAVPDSTFPLWDLFSLALLKGSYLKLWPSLQTANNVQSVSKIQKSIRNPLQFSLKASPVWLEFIDLRNCSPVNVFKDHLHIKVKAGDGGDGAASLLSVYRNEFAGPDGGDGGNGGHVVFKATHGYSSLCHLPKQMTARNGEKGRKKQQFGKDADHNIVEVPLGTIVKHEGNILVSLDEEGAMFVAAKGGAGGKGNMFFTTDTKQAPEVAEHGGKGEEISYEVELRTMADIGLIGFPNAGKSTLLRSISRARPKVASYPFTTLNPHVGVVQYADLMKLAVADIPGLVENAHLNKGLGHAFLRHIQRCSGLLYVIDVSQPEPWKQLDILRYELDQYEKGLSERPHAIVANKVDAPEAPENIKELERRLNMPVVSISAKYGQNLNILLALIRWLTERQASNLILEQKYSGSDWSS